MKRFLVLTAILALSAGVANAQFLYEYNNEIGIYTTAAPTAENAQDMATYSGPQFVQFTCYTVVTNPVSQFTHAPISAIGGFEFRVNVAPNLTVLNWGLPALTTNFATPPEFLAGSNVPVVDNHATVLTMTILPLSADPGYIYLTPVQTAPQSVPGFMAITDYNDDFRITTVSPVSGSHTDPCFGFNTTVVPSEDASWGDVKSLFR